LSGGKHASDAQYLLDRIYTYLGLLLTTMVFSVGATEYTGFDLNPNSVVSVKGSGKLCAFWRLLSIVVEVHFSI
jgi:hypothetical protein